MSNAPARSLARSIRRAAHDVSDRKPETQVAVVRRAEPLEAELTENRQKLTEDDLLFGQNVRRYDRDTGIKVGDSLVVTPQRNGDWVVHEVLGEGDPKEDADTKEAADKHANEVAKKAEEVGEKAAEKAEAVKAEVGLVKATPVRAATAAPLPTHTLVGAKLIASANGPLTAQDGVSLAVNDRLLVEREGTEPGFASTHNGIFVVKALGAAAATTLQGITGLVTDDTFLRTENPLSNGGKWSLRPGTAEVGRTEVATGWSPGVAYGTGVESTNSNGALWNEILTGNQASSILIKTTFGTERWASVLACWSKLAISGYRVRCRWTSTTAVLLTVERATAGLWATLATSASITFTAGQSIGISVVAGKVSAWYKGAGTWEEVASVLDSNYTSGYTGLDAAGNGGRIQNFATGAIPISAASPWELERASDHNTAEKISERRLIPVLEGTVWGFTHHTLTKIGAITLGTTELTFGTAGPWVPATLINGWENYENPTTGSFQNAWYRKGLDGKVTMMGLIKKPTGGVPGVAFQLPVGYRPKKQHGFTTNGNWAGGTLSGATRIDITALGEVLPNVAEGVVVYMFLDEISFYAEQ